MALKIYNTLSRKKEEFIPLKKGEVGIYVCGPTVYNFIHIGNARPFIIFEVVRRFLKFKGYKVRYIQNLTDIDDKMINKARELNISVSELAEKFIQEYFIDADSLNIERADVHPRATEHIAEIIELLKGLEEKGYAYEIDGDVFFEVSKFKNYGKLSGQDIEELKIGARVEVDERKRDAIDFALWKKAKEGEPSWDSPWGKGRPGWHIECSAMSMKYLGKTFDIHAGGSDLIFPHHENEIAQSEANTNQQYVRYWMHNGYLCLNNQKMSKSLGNIMKVRDIIRKYKGEVIRYFILSAHYRSPLNFSEEQLQQAQNSLQRLNNIIYNVKHLLKQDKFKKFKDKDDELILEKRKEGEQQFIKAMDDDFNTPVALSRLFGFAKDVNIYLNSPSLKNKIILEEVIKFYQDLAGKVLGILKDFDKEQSFEQEIKKLIEDREKARKEKNWEKSDKIRDELKRKGVILEDTTEGVRWKKINSE
ncbi:MAG: cysteine--tRNA ligase [Candidatus Infernicultor aquiphilus]|uniref:Cysteine--tRNA ligase n=1 Tax=Candidatus Infernicultor aquiphilus TaxID=1805029 RepID=A0A1J5GRP0_9BACT|nr:MAG: cysteine--tRNA ligase [Candidatus Atribacteria bacterium CG2_30_33_13]PIW11207.1 MAG: cysteine--tRNA ligase [Candidatus Atribacteria bacterium CG17_big_fil_post_rev_8_21_14_2_50_34_11]PIX33761.1 MAG: cysteine--tRNA ligase [Candidatus Atribacteria bacterium CG_4_8_14_3_um_filter_34_18]